MKVSYRRLVFLNWFSFGIACVALIVAGLSAKYTYVQATETGKRERSAKQTAMIGSHQSSM